MEPAELLRIVDSLHRAKNIDKEIVFQAIEAALVSAAKKHYGEEAEVEFDITRENGALSGSIDGEPIDVEETIGRIGAQTAKQVIIQKVREAERDSLIDIYQEQIGQLVNGVVQRSDGGTATVALDNVEALLPRSEQIPGESHHAGERVRAVVYEVKPQGTRVKVILSRCHVSLVQRLFEQEIPEISEGVISINAIAREPGYRSKVAVSSVDQRVDCVGACVGVRGNRIKNIVDELAGERIDIVRFSDDPQVLIPNALQPAEVDEVILCQMMGRAIVLVQEDQLSLAIGRRGQNVRLGSKLCGWDIEIMTAEELEDRIELAVIGFSNLEGVTEDLANRLVGEGYLSYDDLSVIEPDDLMAMGELTEEQALAIADQAEERALEAEEAANLERQKKRKMEQLKKELADAGVSIEELTGATTADAGAATADASAATADESKPPADESGGETPEVAEAEESTEESADSTESEAASATEDVADSEKSGESTESNDSTVET